LHEQQAGGDAGLVEAFSHRPEVRRDDRSYVGVDDGRRRALVFLNLGQDLERDAPGETGGFSRDDLLQHRLVHRICERVDQTDRDRLNLFGEQHIDSVFGVDRIERALDVSAVVDPLVDDLAQVTLDQRRRLRPAHVVEFRHPQRADLEYVPKPLGGDQPHARAFVLQDGVGSDRGAMSDLFDIGSRHPAFATNLGEPFDDRLGVVLDARRNLFGVGGAVGPE
jgi:hypothetical protein